MKNRGIKKMNESKGRNGKKIDKIDMAKEYA